jgi:ankyrin repeat protein
MPTSSRFSILILSLSLAAGISAAVRPQTSQSQSSKSKTPAAAAQRQSPDDTDQEPEKDADKDQDKDPTDAEPAPAAVALDLSQASPLIRELYLATRATKEKDILPHLEEAKKLIDSGADVKATDSQGRTALHWAVFGSSYNTKTKILVGYEEIADAMIQRGVDINHEDAYQDTALDYLLYSPNFEMQTLLLENGATSGFLVAFYNFFNERQQELAEQSAANTPSGRARKTPGPSMPPMSAMLAKADLAPGFTLSVRLDGPVYSDRSRTGDPLSATVTYPLCKNGENVECKPGELILPPGTKVNGTILFAQKAPDKYSRPRLVLDFSNVIHSDGTRTPLYARVLNVDNARETVQNNEILGIVQPHASTKATVAMAALSAANPIAGYTIKGVQTVYGLSIRREIAFPAGTDIQIQIVRPSTLKRHESWSGWRRLPVDPQLAHIAAAAPLRTTSKQDAGSDPTNLIFLGTREQVITAFGEAGWFEADDLNVKSAVKVAQATVRQSGYGSAPMSTLLLDGRPADLTFQKSLNTFARRHHLRIWKLEQKYNGQQVWVAAATHDIETTKSRGATKWNHRIDPHVDRERDWVATDILFAVPAVSWADVDRPAAPHKLGNATGDAIVTDGKISVLELAAIEPPTSAVASGAQP